MSVQSTAIAPTSVRQERAFRYELKRRKRKVEGLLLAADAVWDEHIKNGGVDAAATAARELVMRSVKRMLGHVALEPFSPKYFLTHEESADSSQEQRANLSAGITGSARQEALALVT